MGICLSILIIYNNGVLPTPAFLGFCGGSDGGEPTCNTGDLGSIHGLGRSPGGGMATDSSVLACPEEAP